jgi:hypothetical protein
MESIPARCPGGLSGLSSSSLVWDLGRLPPRIGVPMVRGCPKSDGEA